MKRPALALAALALGGCSHLVVLHDPLTAPEHNDLGVAYELQGQQALALREYQRAVKLDPRLARAWVNLGNGAAASARWDRAEHCYRRAIGIDPAEPDALNNLAWVLLRSPRAGALDEAEALARRATSIGGARDSLYRATLGDVLAARAARAEDPARREGSRP